MHSVATTSQFESESSVKMLGMGMAVNLPSSQFQGHWSVVH